MKRLVLRNLKLRKYSILLYILLLLLSPIFYFFYNPLFGSVLYVILTAFISYITIIESGQPFLLHAQLGKNESYYFHHSLPFNAMQQLNAHYLTTLIMTLFAGAILSLYERVPTGVVLGDSHITTPMYFIGVNLFGHALAFPKCSEVKKDYVPFILYVIGMNIILPIIYVIGIGLFVKFWGVGWDHLPSEDDLVNMISVVIFIIGILSFILTYLYQFKKIKQTKQLD
ncbi:ABC-2 transporter permease [Staphylococcus sp. EZ-P03]|uniref:phenol-soluble modulin export ABC transporter permease subunit PmtB n=1 Tax=Staphylococcus sp. EZ-P03 TaxID=2282739 RepID=UPI000DF7D21B|nr:ABC-2 transporter permease [Staphylococcus sp. EZ-P03]